jgi:Glyoxalase-like domain
MSYLRLRQICLVAPVLGPAERAITEVLGLTVCYRDPHVAKYGLENALWPVGDMFLEAVAPTQPGTAAGRFLDRSGGRGGYMVIFDCSDPERRREHAGAMGLRVVTDITHDVFTGVQLHPRDCRAAMIEFNRTVGADRDPALYAPAGPDWQRARRSDVTRRIAAVLIESPEPEKLAKHWAAIVERSLVEANGPQLRFTEASIRFVRSPDQGERLSALEIEVADADAVRRRAEAAGLMPTARGFAATGVEWILASGRA